MHTEFTYILQWRGWLSTWRVTFDPLLKRHSSVPPFRGWPWNSASLVSSGKREPLFRRGGSGNAKLITHLHLVTMREALLWCRLYLMILRHRISTLPSDWTCGVLCICACWRWKPHKEGYVYGGENTSLAIPCGNADERLHRFFLSISGTLTWGQLTSH